MTQLDWVKHSDMDIWWLETHSHDVAGTVEKNRHGIFVSGVSINYYIDDNGDEHDWRTCGTSGNLDLAKSKVEEQVSRTIQGKRVEELNGSLYAFDNY